MWAAPECQSPYFDAASGAVVLTLKPPDHTANPAVSRDGRPLGWSGPGGYRFTDLGKKPGGGK